MVSDMNALSGWLLKKSSSSYFSRKNRRWFTIKMVESKLIDSNLCVEHTLCYFDSLSSTTPKGWIFLKDVTALSDDGKAFTITTAARCMTLEAQTKAEHRLWLQGIVNLCPWADISKVQSTVTPKLPDPVQLAALTKDSSRDTAEEKKGTSERSASESKDSHSSRRFTILDDDYDGVDTVNSGSGSSSKRGQATPRSLKEDHRKSNFKPQAAGTSARLHSHILRDPNPPGAVKLSRDFVKAAAAAAKESRGDRQLETAMFSAPTPPLKASTRETNHRKESLGMNFSPPMRSLYGGSDAEGIDDIAKGIEDMPLSVHPSESKQSGRKRDQTHKGDTKGGQVSVRWNDEGYDSTHTVSDTESDEGIVPPKVEPQIIRSAPACAESKQHSTLSEFTAAAAAQQVSAGSTLGSGRAPPTRSQPPPTADPHIRNQLTIADAKITIPSDENFVTDNWDDADISSARNLKSSRTPKDTDVLNPPLARGVAADENWLEDNFDT